MTWGNRKTRTRDSGVLLHARGRMGNTRKDFNGPWLMSHEFQIIEGGVGDFMSVAGFTESGEQIAPVNDHQGPQGSRRRERLRPERPAAACSTAAASTGGAAARTGRTSSDFAARRTSRARDSSGRASRRSSCGNRLQYFVNGKLVIEGTDSSFTEGKIMIQSEGAEIYFRRLDLEPLK